MFSLSLSVLSPVAALCDTATESPLSSSASAGPDLGVETRESKVSLTRTIDDHRIDGLFVVSLLSLALAEHFEADLVLFSTSIASRPIVNRQR